MLTNHLSALFFQREGQVEQPARKVYAVGQIVERVRPVGIMFDTAGQVGGLVVKGFRFVQGMALGCAVAQGEPGATAGRRIRRNPGKGLLG